MILGRKTILIASVSSNWMIAERQDGGDLSILKLRSNEDREILLSTLKSSAAAIIAPRTYSDMGSLILEQQCLLALFNPARQTIKLRSDKHQVWIKEDKQSDIEVKKSGDLVVLGGSEIYKYAVLHDWIDEAYITYNEDVSFNAGVMIFGNSLATERSILNFLESHHLHLVDRRLIRASSPRQYLLQFSLRN